MRCNPAFPRRETGAIYVEAIHKRIDIKRPIDRVFAYVDDPATAMEWLPSMMGVRNISGTGIGARHEWTYRMAGLFLDGESTTIAHLPCERRVVRSRGGIDALWTFALEPRGEGTRLELTLEYNVPPALISRMAEQLVVRRNDREIGRAIKSIKDYCEGRSPADLQRLGFLV